MVHTDTPRRRTRDERRLLLRPVMLAVRQVSSELDAGCSPEYLAEREYVITQIQRRARQRLNPVFPALLLVAAILCPRVTAQNANAGDLTEGQPLHLEDAEAAHGAQVQNAFRYTRTYQKQDQYYVAPEWQQGFGQYWHYHGFRTSSRRVSRSHNER
jgi:hypothetical protein